MNGSLANIGHLRANGLALCFLLFLSLAVGGSAAPLPANASPYGISGPTISITGPTVEQSQLTSETLIAAIYYEIGYARTDINRDEYPHIIMAIYEDGTLIWSDDHIKGGPPYHLTKRPIKVVQQFEEEFSSAGLFNKLTWDNYRSMHDPYDEIYFKGPDGYMQMSSSHEYFEKNHPGAVGTEKGYYRFLNNGESSGVVLAQESSKYQAFRTRWSRVKRRLLGLIPLKDTDGISTVTIQTGCFQIEPARVTRP